MGDASDCAMEPTGYHDRVTSVLPRHCHEGSRWLSATDLELPIEVGRTQDGDALSFDDDLCRIGNVSH
jgi:hypothetical protein